MAIPNSTRAWLLLIPLIPSLIVTIFTLYHFLTNRALRMALNNHVIILLLIAGFIEELTDISWSIHFYRTGTSLSSTPTFCYTWAYIGSNVYALNFIFMAWASMERHILIFHSKWLRTKRMCFFLHYLPLIICILLPSIFYFVNYFILPCDVPLHFNETLCCLYTCITNNTWSSYFDSIIISLIPIWTTVIFSTALFIRVIRQKYRIHQKISWGRYKKLATQLLLISALYILLQCPPMIMYTAHSMGLSSDIGADYYSNSFIFTNWIILFTPFTTIISLPELRIKYRRVFWFWRTRHSVAPFIPLQNPKKPVARST